MSQQKTMNLSGSHGRCQILPQESDVSFLIFMLPLVTVCHVVLPFCGQSRLDACMLQEKPRARYGKYIYYDHLKRL